MKINICLSSEEKTLKLKNEYSKTLSGKNIGDPNEIHDDCKVRDITKWVAVIVRKAYSHFDGGLVGEIKTHTPSPQPFTRSPICFVLYSHQCQ